MKTRSAANGISREEAAADVLVLWEEEYRSLRRALRHFVEEHDITDWKIRTAIHSLVFETVRRLNTIDCILDNVLTQGTVADLDVFTRNVLRIATYLIALSDGVAALVTNEAVSIIKRRLNPRLAGFCNAVLRRIQGQTLEELCRSLSNPEQAAIQFSVPVWLWEYVKRLLGSEEARHFFSKALQNPAIYIRVNTLRGSPEKVIQDLESEGFQCTQIPSIPEILKLQRGDRPVTRTATYQQYVVYLQNLSSALVVHVLNPSPDAIVVDLCAAPGSKTSHLAQLMRNRGTIIAIDNAATRILELLKNLTQLGVQNTHIILADGFCPPFRQEFGAEYVLIDPPCSNTGVIQTRPEVKWHTSLELVSRISRLQWNLLKKGSRLVAPNGYAVYSTCSITLEENEHLIRRFLAENPDFKLVPTKPWLGTPAFEDLEECQRLFPHREDTEGFFIAKLHRMELPTNKESALVEGSDQLAPSD